MPKRPLSSSSNTGVLLLALSSTCSFTVGADPSVAPPRPAPLVGFQWRTPVLRDGAEVYEATQGYDSHRALRAPAAPVPFGGPALRRYSHLRSSSSSRQDDDDPSKVNGSDERDDIVGRKTTSSKDEKESSVRDGNGATAAQKTLGRSGSGWVPSRYPNPREHDLQCNIRDLVPEIHGEIKGGPVESNHSSLLLCDPDYALGGLYLHSIADSLKNFSKTFGMEGWCNKVKSEGLADWTVGVGTDSMNSMIFPKITDSRVGGQLDRRFSTRTQNDSDRKLSRSPTTSRKGQKTVSQMMWRRISRPHLAQNARSIRRWFWPDVESRRLEFDPAAPWLQMGLREHPSSPSPPLAEGPVEIGVAIALKMNLPAVLRTDIYYSYEDEDDLTNDAAQYFARYLHDSWWGDQCDEAKNNVDTMIPPATICGEPFDDVNRQRNPPSIRGILIFISVADRVCFISTGNSVSSILPWWRLEHVVADMKPFLREKLYGDAILGAIADVSSLLESGAPGLRERVEDFIARFGVVIVFASFTFLFAAWGEYRDRRRRWQYAETRSKLDKEEKEEARKLQREFHTVSCPICLEKFQVAGSGGNENGEEEMRLPRVDSYGIPLYGNDKQPLKMLRCGHVFDESCWRCWVNSGQGNICRCPVCRQDVGAKTKKKRSHRSGDAQVHPTYDAISHIQVTDPRHSFGGGEEVGEEGRPDDVGLTFTSPSTRNDFSSRALWTMPFWPLTSIQRHRQETNVASDEASSLGLDYSQDLAQPNETSTLL